MDIMDYLHWRSDLSFDERPYNELDAVAFCALCYEILDDVFKEKAVMTLDEAADLFFQMHDEMELKKRMSVSARSYEVLKAMRHTKRYGSLVIAGYVSEIDHSLDLQFSAMTLIHKGKWKAVIFRGTDDTVTGWKEDFSMLYRDEVLAQRKAVEYMSEITKDESLINRLFGKMDYYVAGHSKGGNLAMYACAHVSESVQKRIKRIDNFDGPGFRPEVWKTPSMKNILPVMHTYLPGDSFFGRMFANNSEKILVRSDKNGLMQHDLYNWQVNVDSLVRIKAFEESSDKAVFKLNELIKDHTEAELQEIVESTFTLTETLGLIQISDVTKVNLMKAVKALKELNALDNKTKRMLIELVGVLLNLTF